MILEEVKFTKNDKADFYKELRKRVNSYFKDNNISKYANAAMVIKTIFMVSLYLVPFILMLTVVESSWLVILMWVLMGLGMAGTGFSVMHDANHHAYSKKKWIN
ncbi:MAG TPA: acyl-CoA desaturase, partial [Crocinitomicaceae bacterium]|nr:acyl-CoA desaturase [Crocinitomicaceae bacterium]